jgi:hypothetical protein
MGKAVRKFFAYFIIGVAKIPYHVRIEGITGEAIKNN